MTEWKTTEDLWVDDVEGMMQFQHTLLQRYLERVWGSLGEESADDVAKLLGQWHVVQDILHALGGDIKKFEGDATQR